MHEARITDQLTKNAVAFLLKAAEELRESPRYSLIHLCSGVELLIKARLAHEHWSLVLEKPGTKSLQEVEQGDFKSVGFKDALERVEKVTGTAWKPRDRALLVAVSDHRNRVVHFYHSVLDGSDARLRANVAAEQCRAWVVVRSMVEGPWSDAFPGVADALETLHRAFSRNQIYLSVRLEELTPRLAELRALGKHVSKCAVCEMTATVVEAFPFNVEDSECLVCGDRHLAVRFACPGCGSRFATVPDSSLACQCGREIVLAEMCEQLGLDAGKTRNCWTCWPYVGSGSAYYEKAGSRLFCMTCMQVHSWRTQECRGCGSDWVGCDDTYLVQCPACARDGMA